MDLENGCPGPGGAGAGAAFDSGELLPTDSAPAANAQPALKREAAR